MGSDAAQESAPAQVSAALAALYGVTGTLHRIPEGTATDNYALSGARGARFVKVYRDRATLLDALA